MKNAPWISIEGVDGAGKSSHVEGIISFLKEKGFDVISTREPGGTPLGERLRNEILNTEMSLQSEILLNFAQRAEHLDKVILPALAQGKAVVCDRFTDSTYAYQGCGEGGSLSDIATLEAMVQKGLGPDFTIIFDLPAKESLKRLSKTGKTPDKFESKDEAYFERVRGGYLTRAQENPGRVCVISSLPSLSEVKASVHEKLEDFLVHFKNAHRPSLKF